MEKIQWEIYIKIFNNGLILKGLMIAIGIPFGVLIIVIIFLAGGDIIGTDAKYAPGFIIDDKGITNYTQDNQGKKNKIINTILITFGLYGGNFSAAGSGVIAQSRQVIKIKWKEIRKVKYYPREYTIIVRGNLNNKLAVFCTKENYGEVENMIKEK